MKFLCLFFIFISLNSFAQFRVEIKNRKGEVTHAGEFETEKEIKAWIKENKAQNAWGLPERMKPTEECTTDEFISSIGKIPAIGKLGDRDYVPEMQVLPAEFVVEGPRDISSDRAAEKAAREERKAKQKAARDLLKSFKKSDIKTISDARDIIESIIEIIKE